MDAKEHFRFPSQQAMVDCSGLLEMSPAKGWDPAHEVITMPAGRNLHQELKEKCCLKPTEAEADGCVSGAT